VRVCVFVYLFIIGTQIIYLVFLVSQSKVHIGDCVPTRNKLSFISSEFDSANLRDPEICFVNYVFQIIS